MLLDLQSNESTNEILKNYNQETVPQPIFYYCVVCATALIWWYPSAFFLWEVYQGIMSPQTYIREEYSCCCTVWKPAILLLERTGGCNGNASSVLVMVQPHTPHYSGLFREKVHGSSRMSCIPHCRIHDMIDESENDSGKKNHAKQSSRLHLALSKLLPVTIDNRRRGPLLACRKTFERIEKLVYF